MARSTFTRSYPSSPVHAASGGGLKVQDQKVAVSRDGSWFENFTKESASNRGFTESKVVKEFEGSIWSKKYRVLSKKLKKRQPSSIFPYFVNISDKDSFLWVRKLRIENETQTSPRVGERSLPVPVPGAVPDEDGTTSMIDAAVLFGNEKMRARIVIDAVLFKGNGGSEEEEKNKTAKSWKRLKEYNSVN